MREERKEAISVRMGSNTNCAGWSQPGQPPRANCADRPLCSTHAKPCSLIHLKKKTKTEIIGDLCCRLRSRNPQSLSLHCERSVCLQASKCRAALHLVHGVGAILGGQEGSLSVLLTMERWCSKRASVINTFFFIFIYTP